MKTKHAPGAEPEVCPIARCIKEQRKAAAAFRDESLPADERAGAWQGVTDWLLAEAILRLEEK